MHTYSPLGKDIHPRLFYVLLCSATLQKSQIRNFFFFLLEIQCPLCLLFSCAAWNFWIFARFELKSSPSWADSAWVLRSGTSAMQFCSSRHSATECIKSKLTRDLKSTSSAYQKIQKKSAGQEKSKTIPECFSNDFQRPLKTHSSENKSSINLGPEKVAWYLPNTLRNCQLWALQF